MLGLITKSLREVWLTTLLFAVAMFAIMALLTFVLPQISEGLPWVFSQLPFVKTFITALLGTEAAEITPLTMQSFVWVHPVVLAIIWAHETIVCTRFPAGEVDRGTIDVLLGLPVSRRNVYVAETIVWLITGAFVLAMGLAGHRCTVAELSPEFRPELKVVTRIMFNLYCVYIAVGGIAFFIASFSDRRGRAIAAIFGLVLASFLLNFLAQFWEPAKLIAFLSVIDYYRPARILGSGALSPGDITTLLVTGVVSWIAGGEIVARRSLCSV